MNLDEFELLMDREIADAERRPRAAEVYRRSRQSWADVEVAISLGNETPRRSRAVEYGGPDDALSSSPVGPENEIDRVITGIVDHLERAILASDTSAVSAEAAAEPFVAFGVGLSAAAERFVLRHAESDGPRIAADHAPVLTIYSQEPMEDDAARDRLQSLAQPGLRHSLIETRVMHVGRVAAAHHNGRHSKPCGGCSVFHHAPPPNAGTFGVLARGRSGRRLHRLLLLSNSHVLAPQPAANVGDSIVHPGTGDGGADPADRIARLESFVPLKPDERNYVDAAIARANSKRVRRGLLWGRGGHSKVQPYRTRVFAAVRGMAVGKSGRTTGVTRGYVRATNVAVRVHYPSGWYRFVKQIDVASRAPSGPIAAPGDSGSIVWALQRGKPVGAVGLLFATRETLDTPTDVALANPIASVLDALDIRLF